MSQEINTNTKSGTHASSLDRIVGRFLRLRDGHILGVIDAYGAVHSVFTGSDVAFHAEYFGLSQHCQWRWDDDHSVNWITEDRKPNEEEMDSIRRHLSKHYGLKWWENGHHDIDHLHRKWREEESYLTNAKLIHEDNNE